MATLRHGDAQLRSPSLPQAFVAEFLATFVFVGFSIGAGISNERTLDGNAAHLFILFFHFALALMTIHAFGAISGAHFNPGISFTLLVARRITALRFVVYLAAQLAGGVVGAGLMKAATPDAWEGAMGVVMPPDGVTESETFIMEMMMSSGLAIGAFATAFDPRGWGRLGPLAISIIIFLNIHIGAPFGAGVMNPARAFGPAAVMNNFESHWIYWVATCLGMLIGGGTYEYLFMQRAHGRTSTPSTTGETRKTVKMD